MTLLKLLACRPVEGEWFYLYAGDHKCFDKSFDIAIALLIIALLIPAFTYLHLAFNRRDHVHQLVHIKMNIGILKVFFLLEDLF